MAFCQYCGKKLKKREKCTCEGAMKNAEKAEKEQNSLGTRLKKWLFILGLVAILVIVLFVVVKISTNSKSYLKPVNDYIALVNKKNSSYIDYQKVRKPDFVEKAFEKYYQEALSSDTFIEMVGERQKYLKECYESLDNESDKWKLSFAMDSNYEMDEDDIEEFQDDYDDYFEDYTEEYIDSLKAALKDEEILAQYSESLNVSDTMAEDILKAQIEYMEEYKKVKITAGYEIRGSFSIRIQDEEYSTGTVKFAVVKANGDWCYWGPVDEEIIAFEFDDADVEFIEDYLNSNILFAP